jgi:hypothetical protein
MTSLLPFAGGASGIALTGPALVSVLIRKVAAISLFMEILRSIGWGLRR